MPDPGLNDADARFLERVADDCAQLLGTQIRLIDLVIARDGTTALRARYALGEHEATSEGRGDNLIDAHADLRRRLVVDRIRLGATALVRGVGR